MIKKKFAGFTLLELLVVIIIISIASTVIILNLGSSFLTTKRSEFFARQMMSLIKLARQQAIFGTEVIRITISNDEYSFFKLDYSLHYPAWQSMDINDPFWRPRSISSNIMVSVHSETNPKSENAPQIIIQPSGELTPFLINIHGTDSTKTYTIQGTQAGNIELKE